MPYSAHIVRFAQQELARRKEDNQSQYRQRIQNAYTQVPRLRQIDLELRAEDSEAWFNSITEPKEYKVHDLSRLNTDMVLATN